MDDFKNKKGFTLIELLVVVAIIGILSSVILASLNISRSRARDTKRKEDIHQFQTALQLYYEDNEAFPLCGVAVNTNFCCSPAACGAGQWTGAVSLATNLAPYISSLSVDPINTSTFYGYYYARGYKKTDVSTYINTGVATDYVIATRLENTPNPVLNGGSGNWNNNNVNYLVGN